jgi:hypothetical protein
LKKKPVKPLYKTESQIQNNTTTHPQNTNKTTTPHKHNNTQQKQEEPECGIWKNT